MDERMDKSALRAAVRAQIRELDEAERLASDRAIFENFTALPEYLAAGTVFAYYSVKGEAGTHEIIADALRRGKRVALPAVLGQGKMEFALLSPGRELSSGALYGIPEPDGGSERVEPRSGDIIIVPALCFDAEGFRLGQGGGYYDRWLASHPDVFSAGLCRERFLAKHVPRLEHDMRVRCVVTEKETARP